MKGKLVPINQTKTNDELTKLKGVVAIY